MYLNNRPIEVGIDYQKLAELTEDYASKDIQFICDEAARQVVKVAPRISMHNLLLAIEETTPSSTKEQLMRYRKERDKRDSKKKQQCRKSKIGF